MMKPAHQHQTETLALRYSAARSGSEFEPEHGSNTTDFGIDVTAIPVNGTPLDGTTRTRMEARFGHDFSAVRTHLGPAADTSARTMRARAYTVGFFVLSEASQRAELDKIRERLVRAGQPPEVAAEVCRP